MHPWHRVAKGFFESPALARATTWRKNNQNGQASNRIGSNPRPFSHGAMNSSQIAGFANSCSGTCVDATWCGMLQVVWGIKSGESPMMSLLLRNLESDDWALLPSVKGPNW